MRIFRVLLPFIAFAALVGCQTVQPLRLNYLAVEKPADKIDSTKSIPVRFNQGRFGILYRSPVGIAGYLQEAEARGSGKIIRNADVVMRVPACILLFCFGNDTIDIHGKNAPVTPLPIAQP